MAKPVPKRHITEHEATSTAPPWLRAALRHKFSLNGLQHFDDRMHMTDEEYEDALQKTREHQPGLMEPQPAVPMPVAPAVPPIKTVPAKPREE